MIPATRLAPLVNAYTIRESPTKTIVVPNASELAALQDVTVGGTLLKKQVIALGPSTGRRSLSLGAHGGAYGIEADGDLHFCLGTKQLQPHVTCEVQHAAPWLSTFQGSVGQPVAARGLFRCLFEHPGFHRSDDAHIFEIHPVDAVTFSGRRQTFDVGLPDPGAIHTWTSPHPLNVQDGRIRVAYNRAGDTLTFTDMDGEDENYVRVSGTTSERRPSPGGTAPGTFTFTSAEIGHPLQVLVLPGTNAAKQLAALPSPAIVLVGLRSIDLRQALHGRYVIRLMAIDLQPGA